MTLRRTLTAAARLSLAVAAASLALSSPARAQGRPFTPGEQQRTVGLTRGTWAIYPPGEGQILAQTFTPGVNHAAGLPRAARRVRRRSAAQRQDP